MQPHRPSHAGVRLDTEKLASAPLLEHVEPIPWKTGSPGVVAPLDVGLSNPPEPKAPGPSKAPAPPTASELPKEPLRADAVEPPKAQTKKPEKRGKKLPGSGIPPRKIIAALKWVRRASQVFFFALFMYFLFQTGFRGSFAAKAEQAVRLPLPVEAYLLADPFVAAMTLLSTHTVYRGLLWSLGLLLVTLVFGRVFCGWICPFGTLHHFFGWLLPSRKGRGAARVEANKTHGYQRAKYYLMYAFLIAAVGGVPSAACSTPSALRCDPSDLVSFRLRSI